MPILKSLIRKSNLFITTNDTLAGLCAAAATNTKPFLLVQLIQDAKHGW
ncbi:MAG: hypothetical protein IPJ75_18740 [Ignavibacteriales bacterium]|nr:hypothetical protein [Ignavibacteriales bacterium]